MANSINIDLGSLLPYFEEKLNSFIGRDMLSTTLKEIVRNVIQSGEQLSRSVQIVGMAQPIPIERIYQPTLLKNENFKPPQFCLQDLIERQQDAVIFAGPGFGKTTLLHWEYHHLRLKSSCLPLLFTLRWEGAVESLETIVSALQSGRHVTRDDKVRLVLFVDGYDEVSEDIRRRVSRTLMSYAALDVGQFYLTCREFYPIIDLKALHCRLASFCRDDSIRFIKAFAGVFSGSIDAELLFTELQGRGFADFLSHPLLLALVCILRTSANPNIPTNAIGLVRRAIDTLSFRWDASKSLHRGSGISLDGEERMRCLMRIAYRMDAMSSPAPRVEAAVKEHLHQILTCTFWVQPSPSLS